MFEIKDCSSNLLLDDSCC